MRHGPLAKNVFMILITFLLVRSSVAQEPTFEDAGERQRIRALFRGPLEVEMTERVLQDAFSEEVGHWVTRLRSATTEDDLLSLLDASETHAVGEAGRERVLLEVATGLRSFGTPASLPFLRTLVNRPSEVVALVRGCMDYAAHPVFSYALAARRAEFDILERATLEEFDSLGDEQRLAWFLDCVEAGLESPQLSAALEVIGEVDESLLTELRRHLLFREAPLTAAAGELLVEVYLAGDIVPGPEEFARLPRRAARRLLEEIIGNGGDEHRSRILEIARSHAGVASRAAFLDVETEPETREYLARYGASAAAVLSRDDSQMTTSSLAEILSDPEAAESLRRHAALALIHQKTAAAREAIEDALASDGLSLSLSRKLERWLEQ